MSNNRWSLWMQVIAIYKQFQDEIASGKGIEN